MAITSFGRTNAPDRIDPHVVRIAIVVVLGSIMTILDTTIVNVALASLSKDLHTPLSSLQWVVSAYLLSLAAVIPVCGWAVRKYGAFRIYMQALVLFTLGSALCGLATTAPELIFFRALQGLGGGLLMPTGMILLVQAAGRENLPRVMSAIGVPMVLAPVIGPTLGGFLLQSVSWHAIFMINVPIGVVTAVFAVRLLPRDRTEEPVGRLDWSGLMLSALGTIGITYGLSQTASSGSFGSPDVILPIVGGAVLLVIFVLRSRRTVNPLLDLRLYAIRSYSAASVLMFCLCAALFGAMILLPLYFQEARGEDAIRTGLLLIPQGVGASIGMNRSAMATTRLGAGLTCLIGVVIVSVATIPYLFVGGSTSYVLIGAAMVVRGVGVGLAMMPAMTAAFVSLEPDQVNDASPQLNVIQRVGGSLGTAVIAVVLQSSLAHDAGGPHPSADSIARAFAQSYVWVMVLTLMAVIPAVVLWRIERAMPTETAEDGLPENAVMEILG